MRLYRISTMRATGFARLGHGGAVPQLGGAVPQLGGAVPQLGGAVPQRRTPPERAGAPGAQPAVPRQGAPPEPGPRAPTGCWSARARQEPGPLWGFFTIGGSGGKSRDQESAVVWLLQAL